MPNKFISIHAHNLINATIDGIQPTVDVSPEEIDTIKRKIADILKTMLNTASGWPGHYIPNRTLAREFRLEADITDNIILESELRSLAILIEGLNDS